MEQVAADLKMRLVFSIPGKPRGRGRTERFFRTVNEMFLCSLDGYLARSRKQPALTLPLLEEQFRAFLLEIYHRTPGAEGAMPPVQRWEAGGFLPRMPGSLEQLDLLLMHVIRSRKVRPNGIHFEGLRYLSAMLAAYVGEEITIRYDPREMGEIRVFHRDKFLCRAISAELAGETVSLKEILRARNHQRRELRETIRDRRKAVDTLIDIKRGMANGSTEEPSHAKPPVPTRSTAPTLKRYRNE
jgi:putative transposase